MNKRLSIYSILLGGPPAHPLPIGILPEVSSQNTVDREPFILGPCLCDAHLTGACVYSLLIKNQRVSILTNTDDTNRARGF